VRKLPSLSKTAQYRQEFNSNTFFSQKFSLKFKAFAMQMIAIGFALRAKGSHLEAAFRFGNDEKRFSTLKASAF
jgi:hypothetical protein